MKFLFQGVLMLLTCLVAQAQNGELPKINIQDFKTDHRSIDSSAHAIVLVEVGRSELLFDDTEDRLQLFHQHKYRIKIFDKAGSDYANILIPLYGSGSSGEYLRDIDCKTYNLENGKIVTTEMERSAVFNERVNEYWQETKFTLPNIKDNSIIEVTYKFYSPNITNFKKWEFQTDIPKIYSEYSAVIPATFEYNVSLKGYLPLSDTKTSVLSKYFLFNGVRNDCSKMQYIMKDIPAFKEEAYMLAKINYLSAINFELRSYYMGSGGRKNFTQTWENVDSDLLNNKNFGGQINNNNAFKDILPGIIANKPSQLEQAKALYSYMQKNVAWDGFISKYADKGVKKSLELKRGNIADINLGLICGLRAAGISAYPLLIANRSTGIPSYLYPVSSDFNSVLCLAVIDDKEYLLDASERLLPFGQLSLQSVNDRGRVIYSRQKAGWIPLSNLSVSKKNYNILGQIAAEGKFSGTITLQTSGLEAYNKRKEISKFGSLEEYEEDKIEHFNTYKINNIAVQNLENLDMDLIETITFEIDLKDNMNGNQMTFHPIIIDRLRKNPFLLEERNFPVDLGAPVQESYNINITLPDGYEWANGPKNTALALPEGAARFVFRTEFSDQTLQVQQIMNLNQAVYSPEEYFHLKEFFARIIQQQQTMYQFQKK